MLHHSNINMSSKYAHLPNRHENRYTNSIQIKLDKSANLVSKNAIFKELFFILNKY